MDYIISDLHFGDKGILRFERTEFATVEEHDAHMIKMWNAMVVNNNDTVYFLGDLHDNSHKRDDLDYLRTIVPKLHGRKIIILGNHDVYKDQDYLDLGFEKVIHGPYYYKPYIILSHEPCREAFQNPYVWNIHGHLHNAELELENYICVSARHVQYRPQKLTKIAERIAGKVAKRKEHFMEEWYCPFYDFMQYELQYDESGRVDATKTRNMAIKKLKMF